MARRFSSNRETPRTRAGIIVSVFVVIVLVFNLISHGALSSRVRFVASYAGMIVQDGYDAVAHNGFFSSRASLESENRSLQQQVAHLQEEVASYSYIQQQNQQLSSLAHLAQSNQGFAAPVVSSFRSSPYGTFMIDVPHGEVAASGDLVEDGGGFVVGKIAQAGTGVALVSELFAPGASLDAVVDGSAATAEGEGGGNARIEVPQGAQIALGDPVVAPSLGERPVGVVGTVSSDPSDAYQTISVSVPVNLESLQFVYVVQQ